MTSFDTIAAVTTNSLELRYLWVILSEHLNDGSLERASNTLSYLYKMIENGCYPLLTREKLYRDSVVQALSPFVSHETNLILLSRHTPLEREDWMSPHGYREAAQAALGESVDEGALSCHLIPYKDDIARRVRAGSVNFAPSVHGLQKAVWSSFNASFRKTPLWPQKSRTGEVHRLLLKGAFGTLFEIILYYLSYMVLATPESQKFCKQCERLIQVMEHCFILGEKIGSPGTWIVLVD